MGNDDDTASLTGNVSLLAGGGELSRDLLHMLSVNTHFCQFDNKSLTHRVLMFLLLKDDTRFPPHSVEGLRYEVSCGHWRYTTVHFFIYADSLLESQLDQTSDLWSFEDEWKSDFCQLALESFGCFSTSCWTGGGPTLTDWNQVCDQHRRKVENFDFYLPQRRQHGKQWRHRAFQVECEASASCWGHWSYIFCEKNIHAIVLFNILSIKSLMELV